MPKKKPEKHPKDMTTDDEASKIPAPNATTKARISGRDAAPNEPRASSCTRVMRITSAYLNTSAGIQEF